MTEIIAASTAPFNVEVLVFEEDTYLVLSAGNFARDTPESAEGLMQAAAEQEAVAPGEIVERGPRWYAVVHDFDADDSLKNQHIDRALENIFERVREQNIASIGIQALGVYHGSLALDSFLDRLSNRRLPTCLDRLWVITKKEA